MKRSLEALHLGHSLFIISSATDTMSGTNDRMARKMNYEKERRERISQLFKDLAEALLDAGLPQEAADTQVEALESAIDIIKRWKAKKCEICDKRVKCVLSPTTPLEIPPPFEFPIFVNPPEADVRFIIYSHLY
jgi:hypothetical protein